MVILLGGRTMRLHCAPAADIKAGGRAKTAPPGPSISIILVSRFLVKVRMPDDEGIDTRPDEAEVPEAKERTCARMLGEKRYLKRLPK
jgi:hypothetical protein